MIISAMAGALSLSLLRIPIAAPSSYATLFMHAVSSNLLTTREETARQRLLRPSIFYAPDLLHFKRFDSFRGRSTTSFA